MKTRLHLVMALSTLLLPWVVGCGGDGTPETVSTAPPPGPEDPGPAQAASSKTPVLPGNRP